MANAAQMVALLKSHLDGDDEHFYAVALQVAANEAKQGHDKLAIEIRQLIDEAKRSKAKRNIIPLNHPRGELTNLLLVSYPEYRLSDMVLGEQLALQLKRIIKEHRNAVKILEHGLSPRRKLLLIGPPGTGKTLSASVLAGELGLPLFQIRLDGLITKYMGETAAKLRQIFDVTTETRGVYFFDEFDAIGSERGLANDVGEIRRILNSFLQMIEQDSSNSLIVAATNHPEILDRALFRRFDDVLKYELPDERQAARLLQERLANYSQNYIDWGPIGAIAVGLSYGEITRACQDVIKDALIDGKTLIAGPQLVAAIKERHELVEKLKTIV
ncbi:ATPase central domain-containing protein [uncultured spirochete]|uniref:ATPase central domain-containing protein n=1 Tax=uncultured spirochete TaxID=156406 RepID=A0A3P3XQ80_9SPIR|nr:ATPase central domain-containing protein [uncultured spirochete]